VFEKIQDSRLRGYVVWVPKVGGADSDVPEATRYAHDARASHYWDEGGNLMAQYTTVLELPVDAWDVFMVYGPEARWEGSEPPKPDYWMHQLGSKEQPRVEGLFLDGKTFADKVSTLLATPMNVPVRTGTDG
jgi:hypothetical protein